MLKKFYIAFMGAMAAIWLSMALLFFGLFIAVAVAIGMGAGSFEVKDNSILILDLHGVIPERASTPGIKDVILSGGVDESVPNLSDMTKSIRAAADDGRIKGIYINCGGSELGYASRQELVQAINDFKKSGKWVYAYGDYYSQGDYFVASAASRVFANPKGFVDIHGVASSVPFFKNALDKLGITMQVFKVGSFKSAVEPFLLTEMSEPAKLQTQVYTSAIWNEMSSQIASARKVSSKDVDMWADSLTMTWPVAECKNNAIVDEICYRREVEDKMRKLTGVSSDEDLNFVTPAQYVSVSDYAGNKFDASDTDHIAVLYAVGDIVDEGKSGIVGADMVPEILALADDEHVKGLVLRVNSGGGSAFASEQIWDALEVFKKKKKPFYVSMGDYAASGGYYISCGADLIFCEPATLTGSIGIFGMIPCVKGLLNEHLGVNVSTVGTSPNAAFPQISTPMSDYQLRAMQRNVEDGYHTFTSRVAEGRGLDIDSVLTIAEGRVWDGSTAVGLGLVDRIGSLYDACLAMSKASGIDMEHFVEYPVAVSSMFEQLMMSSASKATGGNPLANSDVLADIEGLTPREMREYMQYLAEIRSYSAIQARMENITLY